MDLSKSVKFDLNKLPPLMLIALGSGIVGALFAIFSNMRFEAMILFGIGSLFLFIQLFIICDREAGTKDGRIVAWILSAAASVIVFGFLIHFFTPEYLEALVMIIMLILLIVFGLCLLATDPPKNQKMRKYRY